MTTISDRDAVDPDRATVRETYQGWRVPAIVGDDHAVGGREHAAYIKRAETKAEAVAKVRDETRVLDAPVGDVTPVRVDHRGVRVPPARIPTPYSDPTGIVLLDGTPLNRVAQRGPGYESGRVTGRGRLDGEVFDVTVSWDRTEDVFEVAGNWPNTGLSAEFDYRRNRTPDCGTGRVFALDCFPGVDARVENVPEDCIDVGRVGGDGA